MSKIRTRFAPSPTGYIHIGNVRSAIYPYLIAKQSGGKFVLRIEDTDRNRYVEGATELIEATLKRLGLNWDEGADIGGKYAPYFQTERKEIYHKWAKRLIDKGLAYADDTPPDQIEAYKKIARDQKQPFLFRDFRPKNPPAWREGIALRFKQANLKRWHWHDVVMGDLSAGEGALDDFILIKQDGLPTYNFGHIIDDAEMKITHIIRGQEYISSMPNYLSLYEALEIKYPIFAHVPHILGATGTKKLSKRDGAKSVTEYLDEGVLEEALLNFLACLGWNDGSEKEIWTMAELVKAFSLDKVQRSGARFDENKLLWLNGQWLRSFTIDELYPRCQAFFPPPAQNYPETYQKQVLGVLQDRLKVLKDLEVMSIYFFEEPKADVAMILGNKFLRKYQKSELTDWLEQTLTVLEATTWTSDVLQKKLNQLLEITNRKPAELFSLIRIALSYAPFSPALNDTMVILGAQTTKTRIKNAIQLLR
ncbi:MAG: glutamate--tRNA ligase [Candidatus Nomurabacteria bacterium]|jgi:glutamyl-tRNA synthetase|nr:glutamate--tRNA ligase [Candidatus Nomurabacteria bacterium]